MKDDHSIMEEEDATTRTTRIFVGGLGGGVTGDDLGKIFSSLGIVKGVDIIRTKGRSFAYFEFLPSSSSSLSKLFSTYNGCVWKGGRLKLEKAKEHYLVRLRREWAEDAELASSVSGNGTDPYKNRASSEKPKKDLNPEKMQLRIFFPKFRKVKSLPSSGTGKHKYSFQRIKVPSLPIHFCDCEEHSVPSDTAKEKYFSDLEAQTSGINEEELNMMKSVMNKLFERENNSKDACSEAGLAEKGDKSNKSIDDMPLDENESSDEDNLITNVVTGGNNRMDLEQETISAIQESGRREFHTSKDEPAQNMLRVETKKIVPFNKKRKLHSEESNRNGLLSAIPKRRGSLQTDSHESEMLLEALPTGPELGVSLSWSQKLPWRELVGDRGNSPFRISHALPDNASKKKDQLRSGALSVPDSTDSENQDLVKHGNFQGQLDQPEELEELAEAQPTKSNSAANKSTRGSSWLKKSSWTQLVGETKDSTFSISQILPGVTFDKEELPKANSMGSANSTDSKFRDLVKQDGKESTANGSKHSRLGIEGLLTAPSGSNMVEQQNFNVLDAEQSTEVETLQTAWGKNELSALMPRKKEHSSPKQISAPKQISVGNMEIGESCSFMRSATSVREWVNTKAAISGSLKKKNKEK